MPGGTYFTSTNMDSVVEENFAVATKYASIVPTCITLLVGIWFLELVTLALLDSVSLVLLFVNGERFAGLNFHIFHSFQEYHVSFSVNISTSLYLY